MRISQKSGEVLFKSAPLQSKDHYSKLFPIEARFSIQFAEEESKTASLLISFDDASGGAAGQVYSIVIESEGVQTGQLTEWLSVELNSTLTEGTPLKSLALSPSMRSMGSSSSLLTTASKKKSLFNFRKAK